MFWLYTEQVAWLSPQMPQMRLVMKCASRGSLPFMNTLYPRKIEDVLWHSTTSRLSKSILVKIPRLPTMRVIGSQDISTKLRRAPSTCRSGTVVTIDVLLFDC